TDTTSPSACACLPVSFATSLRTPLWRASCATSSRSDERVLSTADLSGARRTAAVCAGVVLLTELGKPAAQVPVHGLGADDVLVGQPEFHRMQQERKRLRPAEAAVRADELLEGRHLVRVAPVAAVEHDVGAVRKAVGAQHVTGGLVSERHQGILSHHPILARKA